MFLGAEMDYVLFAVVIIVSVLFAFYLTFMGD